MVGKFSCSFHILYDDANAMQMHIVETGKHLASLLFVGPFIMGIAMSGVINRAAYLYFWFNDVSD